MRCPLCALEVGDAMQGALLHLVFVHPDELRTTVGKVFEGVTFVPPPPTSDEDE